jgi:hypothetical protein
MHFALSALSALYKKRFNLAATARGRRTQSRIFK